MVINEKVDALKKAIAKYERAPYDRDALLDLMDACNVVAGASYRRWKDLTDSIRIQQENDRYR